MNMLNIAARPNSNKVRTKSAAMSPRYRADRATARIWSDFRNAITASRMAGQGTANAIRAAMLAGLDEETVRRALSRALGTADPLETFRDAVGALQERRFQGLCA